MSSFAENCTDTVIVALIWFAAIFGYTLGGALTYRFHESMYPGVCEAGDHSRQACGIDAADESVLMGVLWPIGLPITAAMYAARHTP